MKIKKTDARIVLDLFSLFSPEKFSEKEVKLISKILDRYPGLQRYSFLVEQPKTAEIEYNAEEQYARERKM